jgi:hypothetical protein
MHNQSLRRSFVLFHVTLAIVIFIESVATIRQASSAHLGNPLGSHLSLFAGAETLAAILFLIPKTLHIGSWLLLIIFAVAIVLHGVQNELSLLVFAAGVLFVNIHGSEFSRDLLPVRKSAA